MKDNLVFFKKCKKQFSSKCFSFQVMIEERAQLARVAKVANLAQTSNGHNLVNFEDTATLSLIHIL